MTPRLGGPIPRNSLAPCPLERTRHTYTALPKPARLGLNAIQFQEWPIGLHGRGTE